ncbi:alpha/beta fold hydrolase [Nocardia sp. 348MFTsu5.1]|uniref:alpha/beta fold hydrolase n=1 Tax=Nocardia sp. 348MFTsu5.1 TaxID=1172185 RepID=UPI00037487BF|nr:alpha/beta hydrolase [Nocardia sp. 348MFTsu5.1]
MQTTTPPAPKQVEFTGSGGIRLVADHWSPASTDRAADGAVGTPSPRIVLLMHGGGQTRFSWKNTGALLAAHGHEVISLDTRGHGESDWAPDGDYSATALQADGLGVLAQLPDVTGRQLPVTIVGASLGGLTGIGVAAMAPPNTVDRLILVDVVPRPEERGTSRIRDFMASGGGGFDDLEQAAAAISEYLPHRPTTGATEGLKRNLRRREDGRWYWHWDPAFLNPADGSVVLPSDMFEKQAVGLTIPIQLIRGRLSDVVSKESVDAFRELIPDLEVTELSSAGHTAAGDSNDAFTSAVIDFIDR